jgi:predicted lipoprotein
MVRDVRINGFLGKTPDGDKPKSAIFWRSGATLASINGDLAGLSALFNASKLSAELEEGDYWIAQSIRFEFSNADFALQAADGPIDQVLGDGAKRKKLDYARIVTSSLSELFGVKLAAALDLSAGFSSLDGD